MLMQERAAAAFAWRSNFELQVFRDGRWIISAVYDDRNVALAEAWRLDRAGRMVRLREEGGKGFGAHTIFISTKIKDTWKVERQRIAARTLHPPVHHDAEPQHAESLHPYRLLAIFSLVAFVGLAAIFALRELYSSI